MKKSILLAIGAFSVSAYALPTYEPFTEFGPTLASSPTTLFVLRNGVSVGTNANSGITNCLDLATGGYTSPGGESWGALKFSGTLGTGVPLNGLDIAVISNATVFPQTTLSSLLPATFPGYPPSGGYITNMLENPAQPLIWYTTNYTATNLVGNSAVLKFAQDITRPTSGTKTLFVSYLLNIAQQGQLGAGNNGRYLGFLASTNLVEGTNLGPLAVAYTNWNQMFNTYNGASASGVHCPSHGLLQKTAQSTYYIGACDSGAGKNWSTTPLTGSYGTPIFVVGAYVLNSGANLDTNIVWVNPATSTFGGATPPVSSVHIWAMTNFSMSDLGGLVFIDRVGNGALGGVGTNYIANLIIGSTWSYVTGGPEFTTQPTNVVFYGIGGSATLNAVAMAASQSVTYQWQVISGGATNNLTDGTGTAGGTGTVSGSTTTSLTLTNIGTGDLNTYQCVATASGTSYTLVSSPAALIQLTDPYVNSQPQPLAVTNQYGQSATFTATASTQKPSIGYAWYHNGIALANGLQAGGSTVSGVTGTASGGGSGTSVTTSLTVSNITMLDAGSYTVQVTNNVNNSVESSAAVLTVIDPIIVTQPPTNIIQVPVGGTTNFSVVAAGTGPLSYQWYGQSQGQLSDGGSIHGSATNTLTISNAQLANSDNYYVIVSGPGGSMQSSNAIVYVNSTALGPFSTNSWPTSVAPNAMVDYVVFDPTLAATIQTPPTWNNVMSLAGGADQTFSVVTLAGMQGDQATGTYFNWVDPNWRRFVSIPQIDILLLVYGNSTMYNNTNGGLATTYSYGQVPNTVAYEHSGSFPLGANNGQWNWMLLSVTNAVDVYGYRTVGDTSFGTEAGGTYGGINNGTIRLEAAWPAGSGPTIAAVAFGPYGAFGTSNQVNRFANPVNCAPEPINNLAYIDFNQNLTNNLNVINDPNLGETYSVQGGVGPAGDPRTAIQSTSGQMEFAILNDYLGLPCNENLTMQLCMEVYDDPALVGTQFGPYQYATDSQGDLTTYLGQYYTLTGSGQWLKVAFYFGPANLQGVNTAPLTGGPTVLFYGGLPCIDRVELGVIRTGTNALAGQIPDPNYYLAPLVTCSNGYGYYSEWYPSAGITNNVDISGGYTIVSGVGPANDQRIAEVPKPIGVGSATYEQFALLNNVFGPVYQDNSDVIISADYYDDPALTNNDLYPNTYQTMNNGNVSVVSPQSPYGTPVYLAGTGKWQTASWELPNVNFYGAYLCRFASSAPIYISRVRFNVVRPCGTFEGIDYLQDLGMTVTNSQMSLSWRGQASLLSAPAVLGAYSPLLSVTNTVTNVYAPAMTNNARFFRLTWPGYPSYLSPYQP
jgi:hypothetical protein